VLSTASDDSTADGDGPDDRPRSCRDCDTAYDLRSVPDSPFRAGRRWRCVRVLGRGDHRLSRGAGYPTRSQGAAVLARTQDSREAARYAGIARAGVRDLRKRLVRRFDTGIDRVPAVPADRCSPAAGPD